MKQIDKSDLLLLANLKLQASHLQTQAESQMKDYRIQVLNIYIKYQLDPTDTFDESSGEVSKQKLPEELNGENIKNS